MVRMWMVRVVRVVVVRVVTVPWTRKTIVIVCGESVTCGGDR